MNKVKYEVDHFSRRFRVTFGDILLGWARLDRKYTSGDEEWTCDFPAGGSAGLFCSRDDATRRLIAEQLERQRTLIPEDTVP